MMQVEVLKGGMLTTVQDLGRAGYRDIGVSVGGAMDLDAVIIANKILGNKPNSAVLEVTLLGPKLRFLGAGKFVITGADLDAKLNSEPISLYRAYDVQQGDELSFGQRIKGLRAYIGFQGGIQVPEVLGGKGTNLAAGFGGYKGRALVKGDVLEVADYIASDPFEIRLIPGPHLDFFEPQALEFFVSSTYKVTNQSNRMGLRLEGPPLPLIKDKEMMSEPAIFGAIQVPPSGLPILLGADCQSHGGYPLIGVAASADRSKIAQLAPGDPIRFKSISIQEARELLMTE